MTAPRRRWFRFSLRTLFVVVTAISLLLAISIAKLRSARHQQKVVADLRSVYAYLLYDFHETRANYFDPNARSSMPTWLVATLGVDLFHSVTFANLDSPSITDSSLELLKQLPELRCLHINNASVTPTGLHALSEISNLRVLTICGDAINDDVVECIATISGLQRLEIHGAQVTDAGCRKLKSLANLKRVWFDETEVTDQGVAELRAALPNCDIDN